MTGRKITGLPLPETPREAPPEIHGLVEAIEATLVDSDAMQAAQVLGRTFEYLTRYFAGVAGAIAQHLGLPGDPSVALDFEDARKQLQERMEALGDQATDTLSKLVRGVFYVGATRKAPTPRRHARLLDLGGIPIRGYRSIAEWIAIAPGSGDLSNDSKANRELLRYLPILKEWLTATATYFLDTKQSELSWSQADELHFSFQAEGVTLQVGPIRLPEPLAALLPRSSRAQADSGEVPATPPAPPRPEGLAAAAERPNESSHTEPAGPSVVEPAGPAVVEPAGPSVVEPAGPAVVEPAGPSVVEPAGPAAQPMAASTAVAGQASAASPQEATQQPEAAPAQPLTSAPEAARPAAPQPLPEAPLAQPAEAEPSQAEPSQAEAPQAESSEAASEDQPLQPVLAPAADQVAAPAPLSNPFALSDFADSPPGTLGTPIEPAQSPTVATASPFAPAGLAGGPLDLTATTPSRDPLPIFDPIVADPIPVFEPLAPASAAGTPPAVATPAASFSMPTGDALDEEDGEEAPATQVANPFATPAVSSPPGPVPAEPTMALSAPFLFPPAQQPGIAESPDSAEEPAALPTIPDGDAADPLAASGEIPDNPFAAPAPRAEQTVALRREDFQLDFGALATPTIEPIAPASSELLDQSPQRDQEEQEEEDLELPLDDLDAADLELPEAPPLATPEPLGSSPAAGSEPEPTRPVGLPGASAEAARPARVPPVLPFQKEKERSVPQISVSAPLALYPVVTGPPPEFFDEIPVDADYPEVLQTALTDLNGAIEANDSLLICGQMQRCFDLLIQFFAGIAAAVLQEIDSEALFDFEIEDGRFDLGTKLELVVSSLSSLEEYWEGNDAATLIWSVFYDTLLPATDPNSAYLHTRLLGVEGRVPEGFLEFSELCSVVPGKDALAERSACRETAHRYLPILGFWLENATPLFLESEVDFVEEEGGAALSWAASVAGSTLDGTPSGFWLEVSPSRWNLPRPELAPVYVVGDAPDVLLPVIDELNSGLEKKDYARAGTFVRVSLDFLIQYFAGCAAALWREHGEMSEQAEELYCPEASLEERERLLLLALGSVSTDTVGSALSKVFLKSSTQYRALIRRDTPPGMGPVSEWAARRDEVSESDLLIYLPLLRSWLGASNPWFVAGEQLFEEPSGDGRLEGVVAFGDDFLEMVDPEYVIRLAPECLELIAGLDRTEPSAEGVEEEPFAKREFTGKLPAMPILNVGPPLLIGHLGRLLEAGDDRRAANAWLGSAFEYLIQYFAGLCTAVLGGKDAPLSGSNLVHYNPRASLRERELLLAEAINVLKETASGDTQEKIRDIFWTEAGKLREHARFVGAAGPGSLDEQEMLLSFWCRVRHKTGTLTTEEYHFAMAALTSWLDSSRPFFGICEHYAEDPGADGQEEMVVELAEDYLDMVLPDYAIQIPARGYYDILYRETEAVAAEEAAIFFPEDVRPELLGAKATELGGIADEAGDLLMGAATVELGGDDFFGGAAAYDSSDLFSGPAPKPVESKPATPAADSPYARKQRTGTVNLGSAPPAPGSPKEPAAPEPVGEEALAEAESEAAGRRRKKKRTKKNELGTAVLELYKKERLEKARKRAEARARKEEAEPTKLAYTLSYRGLKNSKQLGGRVHTGTIELRNAGGGEMRGTIEPSHPSVKVTPSRFEGNEVKVTYQIDPSDMPSTGRVGISLNTQDERVEIRMERLVPTSWARERSTVHALLLMATPALVFGMYLLYLIAYGLGDDIGVAFDSLKESKEPLAVSVNVQLWLFAILAMLPGATGVPAAVKVMFSQWDFTVQEETRKILPALMLLPTALMALTLYGTNFWTFQTALEELPILATKHWLLMLMLGLNLLATGLFSTQTTVWWEDNSDTKVARRAFRMFWFVTLALGIFATFFMSFH
jgi:hypothetical protein